MFAALRLKKRSLVAYIRHQGHMARALDGHRQLALMEGAGACDAAGNDLRALGHIFAQAGNIFVVDVLDAVYAEAANLLAAAALRPAAKFTGCSGTARGAGAAAGAAPYPPAYPPLEALLSAKWMLSATTS